MRAEAAQDDVMTRMSLRLPVDLLADIRRAAELAGVDQSEWVRSALVLQVRKDLRPDHVASVARGRSMAVAEPGACIHPPHAVEQIGVQRICRACGTTIGVL